MPDIMKFIFNERANQTDPEGHLIGLEEWNKVVAEQHASKEGITLAPEHWEVLGFLRDHFRKHGPTRHARELGDVLEKRFSGKGGRKYLYQLFPGGPVGQASRIAGLTVPADAADESFGSTR